MKKIKFICLSLAFIFLSCNMNDENNPNEVGKSLATRVYLNAVKESVRASRFNSSEPSTLCFTPIFPIEANYTTGVRVAINSIEGLKETIFSENNALHISNIAYPFSIIESQNNVELIINDEVQFWNLLFGCGNIKTIDQYFTSANCFEFIFPLKVINNDDEIVTISNLADLPNVLNSLSENDYWVDFVYPFKIKYGESEALIQDVWDFYTYVDCTPDFGCICTEEYMPICIQTPNGIVQFENQCWANCAGYTTEDFVSCD